MIEKLKSFIEENNILVQSFLTKDFKDKIKEQLESIYRYIERYMVIKI